jgi:hypothetical protein
VKWQNPAVERTRRFMAFAGQASARRPQLPWAPSLCVRAGVSIALGAALICAVLQACVFVPTTIEVYDPECQVVAKQMTLQAVQVAAIGGCQNQSCVAMILAVGATAAASAIVSGSIVIVGNIAYWLERQSTCRRVNEA